MADSSSNFVSRRTFLRSAAAATAGLSAGALVPDALGRPLDGADGWPPDRAPIDFAVAYEDRFAQDLRRWQVEQQPGGTVEVRDGRMVIDDEGGCTVWFREKLEAPYIIEYTVTPSSRGRVSDVNCFWMATDPDRPEALLAGGDERNGDFGRYDPLRTYYVGMGGHDNTKTRFRRYPGDGSRPMRPEHDRDGPLLTGDEPMRIRIVADGRRTQYIRDGEDMVLFGPKPMHWFWYDDETLMGHENPVLADNVHDLKVQRWTRTGELMETLAGPGNHLSVTYDRASYASETWYYNSPVSLRIYARGDMTPAQQVFTSPLTEVVWEHGAHVNPAFGRNGTRLYFNYPVAEDRFHAAYVAVLPTARRPLSKASSV